MALLIKKLNSHNATSRKRNQKSLLNLSKHIIEIFESESAHESAYQMHYFLFLFGLHRKDH